MLAAYLDLMILRRSAPVEQITDTVHTRLLATRLQRANLSERESIREDNIKAEMLA